MQEQIQELIKKYSHDLAISDNNLKSAKAIKSKELTIGYEVDVERLEQIIADLKNLIK